LPKPAHLEVNKEVVMVVEGVVMVVPVVGEGEGEGEGVEDTRTKIHCVVWPGHIGHKDGAASISLTRETRRDFIAPCAWRLTDSTTDTPQ
jgi:hypothetical protein